MAVFSAQDNFPVRISFPQEDVNRLYAQIKRATKEAGLTVPQSLRLAMKTVLSTLGTSTKVSDEYRQYREVGVSRSGLNRIYAVTTRYKTPKRKGKNTRASWRGPVREQLIYAYNENVLKTRPAVNIAMRGLAKQTWIRAGKKGNLRLSKVQASTHRNAHYARIMSRAAHNWVTYNEHRNLDDPYVMVKNQLPYISKALNGGANSVDTAMERASRGMEHTVDRILKRQLKQRQL